ncbi:TetR/AcrR family transcriptional regulator [Pseudomonas antarctica]|uniref:TetR/AcrR family transcriptional regulator n=1 Tax=Pseudomonas antarctica TaxID=219572 RepID=UPI00387B05A5
MPNPTPRRRDAAVTRDAIVLSARKAFAHCGYDRTGLGEIAAGAGLTVMLVNRYFASKEQLFAEVVAEALASPVTLTPDHLSVQNLGRSIATALVSMTEAGSTPLEGFLIMLQSALSKRAAVMGREQLEKAHQAPLAAALEGAHHQERAALVLALVLGFQVVRQRLELSALAKADPQVLIELLTPLFQQLVDGQPA